MNENASIPANGDRGAALILALLMLSFLAIVGAALLTSVTLDAWVSLGYRQTAELQQSAESAIEQGREVLRTSPATPSAMLAASAGADGALAPFFDAGVLEMGDDQPLVHGDDGFRGRYDVYLRNDAADGFSSLTDTNHVLTLIGIAVNGRSRRILEVSVMKERLRLPAALTLDGSPGMFVPAVASGFEISGLDAGGTGDHGHAIGVVRNEDRDAAISVIATGAEVRFPGVDSLAPPPADIAVVESELNARLRTVQGLERLAREVTSVATDVYSPGAGDTVMLGNLGNPLGGPDDPRIVVVNGDCRVGPGTGYGLLLVRGVLSIADAFDWTGVALVIGQGETRSIGGAVRISGGLLLARTRANDRGPGNLLGSLLTERGSVIADWGSLLSGSLELNRPVENELGRLLPYTVMALRER
ncbi:MAG TPA: hypothetical protein VFY29_16590 [Terriglobia bacterium]|nr:hypothetical protein [Terriglobia bacterium]